MWGASGREFLYGVEYHRSGPGAFDDDIWLEAYVGDSTGMVRGTQGAHKVRLETGIDPIKNMNVQSALHSSNAASRPMGPAPVTSTVLGFQKARRPIASTCSHTFVTTVVGSSKNTQ
jgi:hypothetical protein